MPTREFWALLIQEGTHMASMLIRNREVRPKAQRVLREVPEETLIPNDLTIELEPAEVKRLPSARLGKAVHTGNPDVVIKKMMEGK